LSEHQAFLKPWPFSFSKVPAGKLAVWHGSEDKTSRIANAYLIAEAVAGSQLEVFEDEGHCVLFENFRRLGKLFASGDAVDA
jgi:pimeloyl-ACP methyl ester carboxylesterase